MGAAVERVVLVQGARLSTVPAPGTVVAQTHSLLGVGGSQY